MLQWLDIFLSHSSEDGELVERTRSELAGLGYSVFLDSEALPQVRPEAVTKDTAQALRDAMRECGSLLYLISEKSAASRWMPRELGFFDGFAGGCSSIRLTAMRRATPGAGST